jgi:hypothetical protein
MPKVRRCGPRGPVFTRLRTCPLCCSQGAGAVEAELRAVQLERDLAGLKAEHAREVETMEREHRAVMARMARGLDVDSEDLTRVKTELAEVSDRSRETEGGGCPSMFMCGRRLSE